MTKRWSSTVSDLTKTKRQDNNALERFLDYIDDRDQRRLEKAKEFQREGFSWHESMRRAEVLITE